MLYLFAKHLIESQINFNQTSFCKKLAEVIVTLNRASSIAKQNKNANTVVPLLRDHPAVHTKVVFEEGWSFVRGRKQCKPKHVSSGIVVLNVRWSLIGGVSQEGDYCTCLSLLSPELFSNNASSL